jgi:hypothetical protein
MVAGLCAALAGSARADNRVATTKKGSLLMYSKVELKWVCSHAGCQLFQDTILDIANDYPGDVNVQFYFVNGDPPTEQICDISCPPAPDGSCLPECVIEREHPGWNWVDCEVPLTANQPTYMSLFTGNPAGCQPFTELDPGFPPGRPDPDFGDPSHRTLRGFVYAFAVANDPTDGQNVEIRWNHLIGDALLINYRKATAAEYNAYAAAVVASVANGAFTGTPGVLNLDGVEYDTGFERLVMDFYATIDRRHLGYLFYGALSGDRRIVVNDTDITLHPISADLRQETEGPVRTKAVYDIWNQDERRRSGTEICVECWNQTLASNYPAPNHLLIENLGTPKGKARIEGKASNIAACPLAVDAALLGVQIKLMNFFKVVCNNHEMDSWSVNEGCRLDYDGRATSAITMVGQGDRSATIKYDILDGSDEAQGGVGGATIGGAASVKSSRSGR